MQPPKLKDLIEDSEEFISNAIEKVSEKADKFLRDLDGKGLGESVESGKEFVEESIESTRDFIEERIEKTSEAAKEAFDRSRDIFSDMGVVQTLKEKLDAVLEAVPEVFRVPSKEDIESLREEIKSLRERLDDLGVGGKKQD